MSFTFSSSYQVDHLSLGMCPVCAVRLTHGCEHSNTEEAQEWLAAYIVAEQEAYFETHPVDEAYLLDRADSATEREDAEIASTILTDSEDGRNPVEDKQIRQIFGKVKVTTTAEWRKRHVNQTQEEVDQAKQNWKNISGESERPQ